MAGVNARERLGRAVGQAASGRPGRVLSAAPVRLIGRLIAIVVISSGGRRSFIYWALEYPASPRCLIADSGAVALLPSPLVRHWLASLILLHQQLDLRDRYPARLVAAESSAIESRRGDEG